MGCAFEKVNFLGSAVVNTAEARTVAEWPSDRAGSEAEHAFQLVEQVDGVERGAVAFVHERKHGDAATFADFEELARLRLDALGGVDHHESGIYGGEHPVGVFGEILVTGSVE